MKRGQLGPVTPTVEAIHKINFTGNVIPREWLHHIRRESGAPDANAVLILGEIIYWYRPVELNDERSGRLIGYRRKFAADKLQLGRKAWARRLGLSDKQVDRALATLKRLGLITTELRHIQSVGRTLNNVLFVEPVPSEIAKISVLQDPNELIEDDEEDGAEEENTEEDPSPVYGRPSPATADPSPVYGRESDNGGRDSDNSGRESPALGETYTKTSTEISSQISSAAAGEGDEESLRLELERRFPTTARILKDKLCNRADAADEGIYFECLREDPLRLNWLTLRPSEVRALIKRADAAYTAGKKGFKKAFIDLLDVAVGIDRKPERPSAVAEDEGEIPQTLEERQAIAAKTNSTLPPNLQKSLAAREAKHRGH